MYTTYSKSLRDEHVAVVNVRLRRFQSISRAVNFRKGGESTTESNFMEMKCDLLPEDSLGLEVGEGQQSFVLATVEDEDVSDDDLAHLLPSEGPNFSQSRRFEALFVADQALTPVLCNRIKFLFQMATLAFR